MDIYTFGVYIYIYLWRRGLKRREGKREGKGKEKEKRMKEGWGKEGRWRKEGTPCREEEEERK